jgi:SAM-dependent methyltransferase
MTQKPHARSSLSVSRAEYWEELYRNGDTGWDLGAPTPALVGLQHLLPPNGRMLVLGSGFGHDAIYFAQQGYRTVGVDFSATAVERARQNARRLGVEVEFLQEDLFALPESFREQFDLVLEYVTFCAIDPQRRPEYRDVVHRVLKPGGLLVALFFPTDGRPGGPPFAVNVEEVRALFGKTFQLIVETVPEHSVKPRKGKEVLMLWKKLSSEGSATAKTISREDDPSTT